MGRRLLWALGWVWLAAAGAGAEVTVNLPGLVGAYGLGADEVPGFPASRTVSFTIPDSIASLDGLTFVAAGAWTPGEKAICRTVEGITVCDTLPWGTSLTLRLSSASLGECVFTAAIPALNGVDGEAALLASCAGPDGDPNRLLGAGFTAELFCNAPADEIPLLVVPTTGVLDLVALRTVGAVPVAARSWGAVKALFR